MATSFGHNGHRQAISQKNLKKPVHVAECRLFKWDPISIYIYIYIYICLFIYIRIKSSEIINSLKMCYLQYDVFCMYPHIHAN